MSIRRSTILVMCAVVATFASVASAQDNTAQPNTENTLAAGTLEFTPSISFNRSSFTPEGGSSVSNTHLSFDAAIGRCMTERFELAAAFLAQHRALAGQGRNAFGGSAHAVVNFAQQGSVIPFASAGIGFLTSSNDGVTDRAMLLPMIRAGFRTMIGESRSLNVSVGFQHETNPESTIGGSTNMFEVGVGLSVYRTPGQ